MDNMKRLTSIREKISNIENNKQRLQGQIETYENRKTELEEKCQQEFNAEITELPEIMVQLEEAVETTLADAEEQLSSL